MQAVHKHTHTWSYTHKHTQVRCICSVDCMHMQVHSGTRVLLCIIYLYAHTLTVHAGIHPAILTHTHKCIYYLCVYYWVGGFCIRPCGSWFLVKCKTKTTTKCWKFKFRSACKLHIPCVLVHCRLTQAHDNSLLRQKTKTRIKKDQKLAQFVYSCVGAFATAPMVTLVATSAHCKCQPPEVAQLLTVALPSRPAITIYVI